MAIDVRAVCTCSLGTLISAQISDDYVQGQGLVKCQGSVELSGLYTPAIGTAVTFTYTKGGDTRTIPRKLRVLSSFADPYRRTTRVEVGCKLTYLNDKKDSVDWTAFDDPENEDFTEADARIVTVPIYAKSVAEKCMQELGINTPTPLPLTNAFSIATFDFSPGYVQILSDLLVSESYCGYLDANEVLQVFSLDQTGGTGPVLDSTRIIDLGPIGVGQLPGEAVTVSYSSLKLVKPEITTDDDGDGTPDETLWEYNEEVGPIVKVVIPYQVQGEGPWLEWSASGRTTTTTITDYRNIRGQDVVSSQRTTVTGPVSQAVANLIKQYVESGFLSFNDYYTTLTDEITTYDHDGQGNQIAATTTRYQNSILFMGSLGLQYVYEDGSWVSHGDDLLDAGYTRTEYQNTGNLTRTIEHNYKMWVNTQEGQQAVASIGQSFTSAQNVIDFLPQARSIVYDGTSISSGLRVISQGRPAQQDLTNQANSQPASTGINGTTAGTPTYVGSAGTATDDRDPDNGWRTESKADLELALGSATAQRRIEFSLPYAPDDVFTRSSGGGSVTFTAQESDAPAKAKKYGICQNRLLLGNRSGMNLQLAPELLPAAPFAPLMVEANGLSALYRVNASGWTLNAEGCISTTDALFWGAVGATGDFEEETYPLTPGEAWFPVAPTITALPPAPGIVINPSSGVPERTTTSVTPVWNEKVKLEAGPRIGVTVRSFPYSLQPNVVNVTGSVAVGAVVRRPTVIRPPTAEMTLASGAPQVSTADTEVFPPTAQMTLASGAPSVNPDLIYPPTSSLTLASGAPTVDTSQLAFSNVALLLPFNGTNGSTTFTDASSYGVTVTANGTAQISTAQSVFGGASGLFDGNNDYLTLSSSNLNFGTGDFSIQWRMRRAGDTATGSGSSQVIFDARTAEPSAQLNVYVSNSTLGYVLTVYVNGAVVITGTAATLNTWIACGLFRVAGVTRLYMAGVQVGSSYTDANNYSATNWTIAGRFAAVSGDYRGVNGYLDDLRIVKGVGLVSGASYTVSSDPHPTS